MSGQARISWHVEGDWVVLTIESPGVPAYELRASLPALRRVARVQRLQSAAAGAQIGPGLARVLKPFPAWIQNQFHSEGDLSGAAFSMFAWQLGYGKDKAKGLPTDQSALMVLANPADRFWRQTAGRVADRDKAFKASTSWLKRANIKTTTHYTLGPLEAITKIPVLGPVIKAAASPVTTAIHLAEGQPINQAAIAFLKDNVSAAKAVAPYAKAVLSFVPGVGTGLAAAIAAGAALAEGKPITAALEDAVRSAIPGGELAQAGFDMARKVASGENVGKAALETARAQLPPVAQKAFDIGLAVASGKNMQQAIAAAVTSFAPAELQQILAVGKQAIQSTPGLADVAKSLSSDVARQGMTLASGVLAHAGVNETQIRAMRSKLTGDALQGFDAALRTQEAHFPWIKSITSIAAMQNAASNVASSAEHAALAALAKAAPTAAQQAQLLALAKAAPTLAQQAQLRALAAAAQIKNAIPKPPSIALPHLPSLHAPEPVAAVLASAARAAQNVPGWHGLAAGVGAARAAHAAHHERARGKAERAFVAANQVWEDHEQGRQSIGPLIAQLQSLLCSPLQRDAATRGLHVLGVVRNWRAGLHAQQRAGCGGEATILGAAGEASIVGGIEMPPSPIPVERLIRAGVRPGTF